MSRLHKLVKSQYMDLLLQLPVLFFSVIFHEFAHGFVAYKLGDDTAHFAGRLTFNPVAHIDIIGTIVLPLICYFSGSPLFGWAKPVPINPYRLNNPAKDIMKVAASGPLSNITLAVMCAVFLKLVLMSSFILGGSLTSALAKMLGFGIIINLVLAFFNLIPIIPLDGSNVLMGLLPPNIAEKYRKHAPYGMFIIIGLAVTGLIRLFIIPPLMLTLKIFASLGLGIG